MVSVERVIEYGQVEPEAPLEALPPQVKPPPSWPNKEGIQLDDV